MKNQKKHHIVYKITNLKNNKIYIGVHKTNDINDNYFGSGVDLRKDLKKYGKSKFIKEILYDFKTYDEALKKEEEIVNNEFILKPNVYNLCLGGRGGFITSLNRTVYVNHKNEKFFLNSKRDKVFIKKNNLKHINKDTVFITNGKIIKRCKIGNIPNGWNKACAKDVFKNRRSGILNKISITNGIKNKYILKTNKIPKGWKKGRNFSSTFNTIWINNGIYDKLHNSIFPIPLGFFKGKIKKKFIWINNKIKSKKWDINKTLPKGWKKGLLRLKKDKMIFIHNEHHVIKIKQGSKIPNGYLIGTNLISITNGLRNKFIQSNKLIPNGWRKGMVKK